MPAADRPALRRSLRALRRAVDRATRAAAAAAVRDHLLAAGLPRPGSRIGGYLPFDGEIDPGPLLQAARARGCQVFVPRITSMRSRRMQFAPLGPGADTARRWGFAEPLAAPGRWLDPRWLDLIILPCVGVDVHGHRLGMGAGFYDRRLAFLRHRLHWRRPLLVALAYDGQVVPAIVPASWDVPARAILTPSGFRRATPCDPTEEPA